MMSGICGIIHSLPTHPIDSRVLARINDALSHRGPHSQGVRQEPGAAFAVCILAHSDDIPQQPATNADATIWAALDGAIYNAAELRAELTRKGHDFRSQSDAELVAHLYEEMQDNSIQRLIGEYAIAVWDARRRRLLLVRDRLGVKPLYLAKTNGRLSFASELTALLADQAIRRDIDLDGLSEYLTFAHALPPRTILSAVKKLPAGYVVCYADGRLALQQYWDVRFPPEHEKDPDQARHVERFRAAFAVSVERRLLDARPTGAFLSGGMDSSSITAIASHMLNTKLYTYAGGCRLGGQPSELDRSKLVADYFNTHHHELCFTAEHYHEMLPRFIAHMDEPVADEASLIRMLLAEYAQGDVSVILGGEGGDDVTAGYSFAFLKHRFDRLQRFQQIPRWVRAGVPRVLGPVLPGSFRAWLARGNRDPATILADEHYAMRWDMEAHQKARYCPPLDGRGDHCHDALRDIYAQSGTRDPLSQALYVFTKTWLPENLMMSSDKMCMSYGIEYRAPYTDHELVELSALIPSKQKVRQEPDGTYTIKAVLKEAMRGILPDTIMQLPKSPFQVPATEWFRDELAHCCQHVLTCEPARASGLYDPDALTELLDTHRQNPATNTMLHIRNLLFFEMWRQKFLEQGKLPQ